MLLIISFYVCVCAAIAGCMFIPFSAKEGFNMIVAAILSYTIVWCAVKVFT